MKYSANIWWFVCRLYEKQEKLQRNFEKWSEKHKNFSKFYYEKEISHIDFSDGYLTIDVRLRYFSKTKHQIVFQIPSNLKSNTFIHNSQGLLMSHAMVITENILNEFLTYNCLDYIDGYTNFYTYNTVGESGLLAIDKNKPYSLTNL